MLFCKLQFSHSIMEQKEQLCPVCRKNDMLTRLELYQINFTTAVYMCKHQGCVYPKGYTWLYVDRNILDSDTSDDDSNFDFEHDVLNETNSSLDKSDESSKLFELDTLTDTQTDTSIPKKLNEFKIAQEKNATQMENVTSLLGSSLNKIDAPVILADSDECKTRIQEENIKTPNRIIKILKVDKLPFGHLTQIKPSNDIKSSFKLAQTAKVLKDNRVLGGIETEATKEILVEIETEEKEDALVIRSVRTVAQTSEAQISREVQIDKFNGSNKIQLNDKHCKGIENKLDLASVFTRTYNYKCKLDKVKPKKLCKSLVQQVNCLSKTTNIIKGHSKRINKASTFEGFQFHTNIIKPAAKTLNTENIQKRNIIEQKPEKNTSEKDEFDKLVLDDFFSNIDNIQPISVPENTVTDIDDWLQNL